MPIRLDYQPLFRKGARVPQTRESGGNRSLRGWRDFARECFCFGCKAVNGISGEAVGGLVKSRVEFPPAQIRRVPRSPVHANFGLAESAETSIKC